MTGSRLGASAGSTALQLASVLPLLIDGVRAVYYRQRAVESRLAHIDLDIMKIRTQIVDRPSPSAMAPVLWPRSFTY